MSADPLHNTATLAALMVQASARGHDPVTLRALVEEACELGAARALSKLGLHDRSAPADIAALRELLSSWRDAKRAASRAVVSWLVRLALAGLLIGLIAKFRLIDVLKP